MSLRWFSPTRVVCDASGGRQLRFFNGGATSLPGGAPPIIFTPMTHRIDTLAFPVIEELIRANPLLVVPIGGLEPLGRDLPLGTTNLITQHLADRVGAACGALVAPVIGYGATVPSMSFGGVGGVKGRHLETFLVDLLRCWTFQGVRRFVLLDGTIDNAEPVERAARRHLRLHPACTVTPLCWQTHPDVRRLLAEAGAGDSFGRCERALRALGRSASGVREGGGDAPAKRPVPDKSRWTAWRRRGRDPEKYRSLYPDARTSTGECEGCATEELFGRIAAVVAASIAVPGASQGSA